MLWAFISYTPTTRQCIQFTVIVSLFWSVAYLYVNPTFISQAQFALTSLPVVLRSPSPENISDVEELLRQIGVRIRVDYDNGRKELSDLNAIKKMNIDVSKRQKRMQLVGWMTAR